MRRSVPCSGCGWRAVRECRAPAGETSLELPIALPLPIFAAWATLMQQASRLGVLPTARTCAPKILDHFTISSPRKEVWQQNPMDALRVHEPHTAQASGPLLRGYVLAVYCHMEQAVAALPSVPPEGLNEPYLEGHIQRLLLVKRLLLALHVCLPPFHFGLESIEHPPDGAGNCWVQFMWAHAANTARVSIAF
jgi:hypothetical protein